MKIYFSDMRGNIWRLNSQLAALLSLTSTNTYTEQTSKGNPEFIMVSWTQPAVTTHLLLLRNIYRPSVILFTRGEVLSRGVPSLAGDAVLSSTPPPRMAEDGTPPYGQQAGGMHPTGMLSCYCMVFYFQAPLNCQIDSC